jgi:hypothetical protein
MRKTDHQQPAPDESLKMAHQVINSSWQILKRHHDNTQWDILLKDLDSLVNEYRGKPALETLAYNIALGVYDFLGFCAAAPGERRPASGTKEK